MRNLTIATRPLDSLASEIIRCDMSRHWWMPGWAITWALRRILPPELHVCIDGREQTPEVTR